MGLAKELGVQQIQFLSDSQLVVNQIQGTYQTQYLKMTAYLKKAIELKESFMEVKIQQIPRDENSHADALENLDSVAQLTEQKFSPIVYLKWPVVWKQDQGEIYELRTETTWITPIFNYIQNEILPENKEEARKIKATFARFTII